MRKLGDHPHVVSVLDTGEEGGNPFIVSEYMPGGDVEGLLAAAGRAARGPASGRDRLRRLPGARARPRAGHRPPRPEAGQRLARRRRPRPPGRLRPGDHRGPLADERRHPRRHGRLPAARAGARRGGGPRERPLLARSAALRDADRPAALPGRRRRLDHQPAPARRPGAALAAQPRRPRGARPGRARPARQAPRGPPRQRRRGRASRCRRRSPSRRPAEDGEDARRIPLDSLAGGVYVGRERELERCARRSTAPSPATARLLLLVGEPGIGKTRAAEELATYARVSGARVHWGRCREDEGAPAYWPWVQAIALYVRDSDPVALAWQMGGGAAEIAQLVPEVAERLDVEPAGPSDSEEARFRLFDSVTSFLRGGRARPPDGARPRRPALGG